MSRLLALLLVLLLPSHAAPGNLEDQIPDILAPWVPWVLDGEDPRPCPPPASGGERLCAWPGRLHLDLDAEGGLFAQHWTLYERSWVPLPGGGDHWPQDVHVGEKAAAVVGRDGLPMLRLPAGEHTLSGRFAWNGLPQGLVLPPADALVELSLDGRTVPFPRIGRDGRLWLASDAGERADAGRESLGLRVSRRLEDNIPLRVVTRLELDVAGRARELVLGPVLLDGGIPLGLSGPLPARLEPDGRLRLQVRPGHWVVEVTAHHPGPVTELTLDVLPDPWPREEVWVFAAHPELRQVEVTGVEPVDPRQTRLPSDWAGLPAYLLHPGMTLAMQPLGRGDATPGPDRLTLDRDLWLDFDGGGYTLRDTIAGALTRSWRLEVDEPLRLGRVEDGGEARLITRLGDAPREGVEVRQGSVRLVAESRIGEGIRSLPAAGWALDFDRLETRLHLPPGWDLLAVAGVDNLPDTWVNRWSLLDLFLVLLIGIGAGRLWGPAWGALALAAVVLTWHAPGAPQLIWLNLLAAVALLRLLPEAPERAAMVRLRGLLALYYRASLVALAVIALPFLVEEARTAIYPQLEGHGAIVDGSGAVGFSYAPETAVSAAMDEAVGSRLLREKAKAAPAAAPPAPLPRIDPDAKVQTGPGVPDWDWTRVSLEWSGPVPRDHRIELWLLSPGWNLALAGLRLVLILILALKVAGVLGAVLKRVPGTALVLLAAGLGAAPGPVDAQGFPSPELLQELRGRLLEPPDCLPACADIPLMELTTEGEDLQILLTLNLEESVAVPIPGGAGSWTPARVTLDGAPLDALRRTDDGTFLLPLPAGSWRVGLSGPLPPSAQLELPLPLRPHRVVARSEAFTVEGLDEQGRPGAQIQLVRRDHAAPSDALEPGEVPPLLRVRRTLHLDLDWRVETRVLRLSPPEYPVALPVPLLPGEQVLSEGSRVSDGTLQVSLSPGQRETGWISNLEPVDSILLHAAEDPRLSEEWQVDVGARWHLETEGIPVIHHQGRLDPWLPTWRPWPGEEVRLLLSRPAGVEGPTLTLVGSDYRIEPGQRAAQVSLGLTLLSSQGDRHPIRLPDGAELERVRIDGTERPLRLEGRELILPLVPATQRIDIDWRQPNPVGLHYAPPMPDLGLPGVNANLHQGLGPDRWVLFVGGPALGPAVLFWGLAVVLVLVALGLGHSRFTPLRTWDWLLLGLGLSQAGVWTSVLVAGWLFALGLRGRLEQELPPWRFNLMQIGLVLLSLVALSALVGAVQQGLLGQPDMQIAGNGSNAGNLNWYQDRTGAVLPQIWVISVPILVYRMLMLAWALWLAFRVIAWLRWGWEGLSTPVLWRELKLRLPSPRAAPKGPPQD